jgi:hypothetical protein
VIGDMTQVSGVPAFFKRTASVEVTRQFSRSALYFSDEWSPSTGGSYGAQALTPMSSAVTIENARSGSMPLF